MSTTDILAKLDQLDDLSRAIRAAVMAEEKSIPTTELGFQAPSHWPVLPKGDSWHNPDELAPKKFGADYRPLSESELTAHRKSQLRHWRDYEVHWLKDGAWSCSKVAPADKGFTFRVPAHWPIGHGIPNFNTNETQAES